MRATFSLIITIFFFFFFGLISSLTRDLCVKYPVMVEFILGRMYE